MVDGQEAARRERCYELPHDGVCLIGVRYVVQDTKQHERNRLGEVEGPRRLGKDFVGITQVAFDVGTRTLRGAGK